MRPGVCAGVMRKERRNALTDTKEQGLETIIVNYLRDVNGYVEGTSDMYSKDVAVVKPWLEAFLVATQSGKVAQSM